MARHRNRVVSVSTWDRFRQHDLIYRYISDLFDAFALFTLFAAGGLPREAIRDEFAMSAVGDAGVRALLPSTQ